LDIGEIIKRRKKRGSSVELDLAGVVCKSLMPFLLGDRTLLKDVWRTPWMSSYKGEGVWEKINLPPHGNMKPDQEDFILKLKNALLNEIKGYLNEAKTVGILLSGGMDSRVVAAVTREMQLQTGLPEQVVALTWGLEDSRDVVYAGRIARKFGWDFVHFPLNSEVLAKNIEIAARNGAEVSPLHYHAIPQISELKGIDVIIAGSYGDSVGRAEFSGKKVTELKPVFSKLKNRFGVLKHYLLSSVEHELKVDACCAPFFDVGSNRVRQLEIEQERHYMRRMLQSCMFVIARRIPFYQMFTAPDVFSLMWSLSPSVRDDSWYIHLLKRLPGNLLDIPWARTGRIYGMSSGEPDKFSRFHHKYGLWLRSDLKNIIIERVNSDRIRKLGIYNNAALDKLLKIWTKATTRSTNSLDELFSWLACFAVFLERNEIKSLDVGFSNNTKRWQNVTTNLIDITKGPLLADIYVRIRDKHRE
jgi:asparagine synthase (glutamine-hydrolysing)